MNRNILEDIVADVHNCRVSYYVFKYITTIGHYVMTINRMSRLLYIECFNIIGYLCEYPNSYSWIHKSTVMRRFSLFCSVRLNKLKSKQSTCRLNLRRFNFYVSSLLCVKWNVSLSGSLYWPLSCRICKQSHPTKMCLWRTLYYE